MANIKKGKATTCITSEKIGVVIVERITNITCTVCSSLTIGPYSPWPHSKSGNNTVDQTFPRGLCLWYLCGRGSDHRAYTSPTEELIRDILCTLILLHVTKTVNIRYRDGYVLVS